MAFTAVTKPTQGATTKKSLIDTVIDDLAFLYSRLNVAQAAVNGSFENDTDSDGIPDEWTRTLYTGGTFLLDNTDQQSGLYSIKFTSPGGGGNGGGYIESTDPFPVSPNRQVEVRWEMKSSAAGVSNRVEVYWFKSDLTASGTPSTTLYSSTTNPTSWTPEIGIAVPPSDARFAKLRFTGCHTASATAGNTRFDNILCEPRHAIIPAMEVLTVSSTWIAPAGVSRVRVKAWGGGAGGGLAAGTGAGGGGGGFVDGCFDVTPLGSYAFVIGAGGVHAIGGTPATPGADTTFGALVTATGGAIATGASVGGVGGGGTATGALILTGQNGYDNATTSRGGSSACGGFGGIAGGNGLIPGGAGGGGAASSGGDGARGQIVLEY